MCAPANGTITAFDAPDAGTDAGQGTAVGNFFDTINPAGATTGYYFDASFAFHAWVRAPNGTITEFDAPGAGTGAYQGTDAWGINPAGTTTGFYWDASGDTVYHGFLRKPNGTFILFDVPGAGTDPGEGTQPGGINPWGAISGLSIDGIGVAHGFVRAPNGTITVFDAPGAGNGGGQGTAPQSINEVGEVTGGYVDANFVAHGFVRKP